MAAPEPPAPDTKDWTWVIENACPDCGFDPCAIRFADVAPGLRAQVPVFAAALAGAHAQDRPDPATWSPVEYGCHVRDVCRRFVQRLRLMLDEDDPQFENWDQDATAVADRYDLADPATVAAELARAAEVMAAALETVREDQLARRGRRSNGSVFTVQTLASYFLHDVVHHAWDVRDAAGAR